MTCDVLVLGGGAAGMAAALAAARQGARTLLVERAGMLGGMATLALVHSICGLYFVREEPDAVYAHGGIPREFAEALLHGGGAEGPIRMGRSDVLLHSPIIFAMLADKLVQAEKNLGVLFHSELIGLSRSGGRIAGAEMVCRGRRVSIAVDAVIDASGDGVSAALLEDKFDQSSEAKLQRPAYIVELTGIDPSGLLPDSRLALSHLIVSGVRSGALPADALGSSFRKGVGSVAFLSLDLDPPGHDDYDPLDSRCLTSIEQHGRAVAISIISYLSACGGDYFKNVKLSSLPIRAGVRESRRLRGRATLDARAILEGGRSGDDVALATWPMEMRETTRGPRLIYQPEGKAAGIPLGCLRSESYDNLFFAGRCISATHEAQASIRVIGTCMATGEAAGIAASLLLSGTLNAQAIRERNGWDKVDGESPR